jgi:hypothetical protein
MRCFSKFYVVKHCNSQIDGAQRTYYISFKIYLSTKQAKLEKSLIYKHKSQPVAILRSGHRAKKKIQLNGKYKY